MRIWHPSLELCTRCQVVSMNFGPGYIFFCQHSHGPHPDHPASGREEEERDGGGGGREEGFSCPGAAFPMTLFYMTEAIWQLHYLFLLLFTPDLACSQDVKTHAQTETLWASITFVSTRLKSVSWRLNEVSAAKPSLWNIRDPFCKTLCDDNHRPVILEIHMHYAYLDMCV